MGRLTGVAAAIFALTCEAGVPFALDCDACLPPFVAELLSLLLARPSHALHGLFQVPVGVPGFALSASPLIRPHLAQPLSAC